MYLAACEADLLGLGGEDGVLQLLAHGVATPVTHDGRCNTHMWIDNCNTFIVSS